MTMTYVALAASIAKALAESASPNFHATNETVHGGASSQTFEAGSSTWAAEERRKVKVKAGRNQSADLEEDGNSADSDIASSRSQSPTSHHSQECFPSKDTSFSSQIHAFLPATPISESLPPQQMKDMSDDQLYQAKILVLDLLGWGVPPEYILQRGVSHELIYTVFMELKLRLPENIAADYAAIVNARSQP